MAQKAGDQGGGGGGFAVTSEVPLTARCDIFLQFGHVSAQTVSTSHHLLRLSVIIKISYRTSRREPIEAYKRKGGKKDRISILFRWLRDGRLRPGCVLCHAVASDRYLTSRRTTPLGGGGGLCVNEKAEGKSLCRPAGWVAANKAWDGTRLYFYDIRSTSHDSCFFISDKMLLFQISPSQCPLLANW